MADQFSDCEPTETEGGENTLTRMYVITCRVMSSGGGASAAGLHTDLTGERRIDRSISQQTDHKQAPDSVL